MYACVCMHLYAGTFRPACVCLHVYACTWAYVCVLMHVRTCMCFPTCLHVHVYTCTCMYIYPCICEYACVCLYKWAHTRMHTRKRHWHFFKRMYIIMAITLLFPFAKIGAKHLLLENSVYNQHRFTKLWYYLADRVTNYNEKKTITNGISSLAFVCFFLLTDLDSTVRF